MEIEDRANYLTDLIQDVAVFSRGERLMFGEEFMVDVIHYGIVLCLNDNDLTKEENDTLYEFVR